ncbi:hypothetical protein [Nitrosarchaeum koreense]|uniref:hypothetical protein n=1 Tax=Nitrosarchaeum koreense TaxID=1088740 RepID=UPI00064FEEFC|nr:hypothetical protein [Nitrosarchaeum koreense]
MQKTALNNKQKFHILILITGVLMAISIPVFLPHFLHGHGVHTGIHLASISLGSFLSVIGVMTYLEYKTKRLLLVFFAFATITIAETLSALNIIFLFWASYSSIDSVITHLLILMMLTFFSIGIFKRD